MMELRLARLPTRLWPEPRIMELVRLMRGFDILARCSLFSLPLKSQECWSEKTHRPLVFTKTSFDRPRSQPKYTAQAPYKAHKRVSSDQRTLRTSCSSRARRGKCAYQLRRLPNPKYPRNASDAFCPFRAPDTPIQCILLSARAPHCSLCDLSSTRTGCESMRGRP